MNTLLLAPELFSGNGGIPRILRLYLQALRELAAPRERVEFVTLNDPGPPAAGDPAAAADDRLAGGDACGGRKGRFIRCALRRSRGADRLVCGHVAQLPVAWLARRLHPRLRYVLIAHGIEVWRPFRLTERVALRGAAQVWCVSAHTRRELLRRIALPEERCLVLPNALDPSFSIAAGRPLAACPPVILTVTRLAHADRYKGVDRLIAALPAIRSAEPAARLKIVGEGDDLPRLRRLADGLGLPAGTIEFTGFLDDRRLEEEMGACRLFALPSTAEGFGLVFLEAMARGRPCVGAAAGGVPEVLSPATGLLVPPADAAALAAACAAGLARAWDEQAILARARHFSYSPFKDRLASILAA